MQVWHHTASLRFFGCAASAAVGMLIGPQCCGRVVQQLLLESQVGVKIALQLSKRAQQLCFYCDCVWAARVVIRS
jgi:hypothetical protein